jgi:outer membrane protein OmpA-like peptidoglycan-associated protein
MALIAAVCGCAPPPVTKPAPPPPPKAAIAAHGAVSSAEARAERIDELLKSGVAPIERRALPAYLDSLQSRLRAAIAGNTADIARVEGELVVVLPARVLFEPDAAQMTPAGEKFLATLAELLRGESALLVEAACHTDRLGNTDDNQAFSARRAELVLATLTAQGLDGRHVISLGAGDRFPIADNATADGRRQNRRIEVSLIPIVK